MIKECIWIPTLETGRLILRKLMPSDAADLREWFGLPIVYKYWGRPAGKGEQNPELLLLDPRPNVIRKPAHDFIWGIIDKDTGKVMGMIEVFDVENDRIGQVGYRVNPAFWGLGLCTEALKRIIEFIYTETKLDRLAASADTENIASNTVLKNVALRGRTVSGTVKWAADTVTITFMATSEMLLIQVDGGNRILSQKRRSDCCGAFLLCVAYGSCRRLMIASVTSLSTRTLS